MKKRLFSAILSLAMLLTLLPTTALAAEPASGSCGSGVTWSYDGKGTLKIDGSGTIPDYSHEWEESPAPWWEYRTEITTIIVGNNIKRIGNEAFGGGPYRAGYPQLASITIGTSVKEIGAYAFSGAGSITKITLPSQLTAIEDGAFYGSSLTEITIPQTVENIAETAFLNCTQLSSISVNSENDYYSSGGGVLYEKLFGNKYVLICYPSQKLEHSYTILEGTIKIADEAFASNTNLTSIVVPNSVTEIPDLAFAFCSALVKVDLPDGIASVSSSAFAVCTALEELHIPASVEKFTAEYTVGEWFGETYQPLSVYFYGNKAPAFDGAIADLRDSTCPVTIYYPANATGWSAVQQQDNLRSAIENGTLQFKTWHPASGGDPETPPTSDKATILKTYPVNGADDVGYDASNEPYFEITFDRDISAVTTKQGYIFADLDFSKGSMKIFRSADDMLIYEVTYDDYMNDWYEIAGTISSDTRVRNGNTLVLNPFNEHTLLDPGTEYYITVDEGFVRFEDGTVSPRIESHEWKFSTETTTFLFLGFDGKTEREYKYHFSESFFTSPSTFYDHELAKMSLNLALSAFNSATAAESGYKKQEAAKNVVDLMQNMGFKDIDVGSYEGKPSRYSIAEAIGQKQIQDHSQEYTLIAVAVRGGGYEMEWASNVSVFSDREHQGFSLAASNVMNDLLQYIIRYVDNRDHIKLWITGYSRGAAVANLMSAKLSQQLKNGNLGNLSIDQSDIYTYTFATPMARAADGYDINTIDGNIFNIVSPVDIVPMFTPEAWGYYRYGYTYCLPSAATNSDIYYDHSLEVATEVTRIAGGNYAGTFSTSQGAILQNVVDLLDIMEPDGTISITIQNVLANYFEDKYGFSYKDNGFKTFITEIKNILDTAETLKDIAEMNFISLSVNKLLKPAIVDGGIETLEMVLDIAARAHYPEVYLAWMNAIEKNELTNGTYRKMSFNCPVDISVYDDNNTFVAGFRNDEAINVNDEAVDAYIDENGQKVVIIPFDRKYKFLITATDSGSMTYTVEEYSTAYNQVERLVSYYDLDVSSGDQFTGTIADNPGAETEYPLFKETSEGQEKLIPSVDQDQNTVKEFSVSIDVIGNGTAIGSGTYVNGQFVQVSAIADKMESFVGWYKDGNLLSESPKYRFLVDDDISLTAVFTANQETPDDEPDPYPTPNPDPDMDNDDNDYGSGDYLVNVDQISGGRVTVQPDRADKGDTVTITVYPNDGYELGELIVTDSDGNEITVHNQGERKYTFIMPASIVKIKASFKAIEGILVNPFYDVSEGDYYYDAVLWAVANGVTNGTNAEGTSFSPDATVTRAQMVTFLWRAHGSPKATGTNPFTDVSASDYYYDAVLWAVADGVTNGTSATTFSPDAPVTRAQAVTFQWRAAGSPITSGNSFQDVATDAYYADAVIWAVANGITNGTGSNTFSPNLAVSRAQAVTFLYRELTD